MTIWLLIGALAITTALIKAVGNLDCYDDLFPMVKDSLGNALRIIRPAGPPVAVQIQPGRHSAVRAGGEVVGHRVARLVQHLGKGGQCQPIVVPVDPGQQDRIGCRRRNHPGCGQNLRIGPANIAQQQPRSLAGQTGIIGGDTQTLGRRRTGKAKAYHPDKTSHAAGVA